MLTEAELAAREAAVYEWYCALLWHKPEMMMMLMNDGDDGDDDDNAFSVAK